MRGHRAKQYRKLMHQYSLTFKFREPYQVLVDAQIVHDAAAFKMDLLAGLKRTLQGEIKPMITQCSMRHIYKTKDQTLIEQAKGYERRRCNHHELEEPLDFGQCLQEVVNAKGNNTNKHRYIVATQDAAVRAEMRRIPGVPLVYISRSVMILEPMARATEKVRSKDEKDKFRNGIRGARGGQVLGKRTRDESDSDDGSVSEATGTDGIDVPRSRDTTTIAEKKKKPRRGPKEPNPLSTRKSKKKVNNQSERPRKPNSEGQPQAEETEKRKRKRKRKTKGPEEATISTAADT